MKFKETCPNCNETFYYEQFEQVPGFRFPEELVCPYCGHQIKSSLEWDFITYKKEEIE